MGIAIWLLIGTSAALGARFIVPGREPIGLWDTLVLGIVGSLIGGFLASLVFDGGVEFTTSGVVGSIVGAAVLLVVTRSGSDRVVTL